MSLSKPNINSASFISNVSQSFSIRAILALHEGVYNSNNNTITYGHIDNTGHLGPIFGFIFGMIYTAKEQRKIIFGGYKEDAFGLPVRWTKPKNVEEIKKAALEREAAKAQQATTE